MRTLLRVAVLLLFLAGDALAQGYPTKPVKLIVPFPPGGNTDIVGRLFAQKLSEAFGQQVYVDNRGGAGGAIGADAAAKSPNDGYTLFFGTTGTLAAVPAMRSDLPYDPIRDFTAISTLANAPVVVMVRADVPANTLRELVALAKAKPGQLKYGSAGTGHFVHLAGEMFATSAGVELFHVPFKGVAAALVDVLGGRIELMFDAAAQYEPHFKSGKLRPLAVAHPTRLARLPEVPTTTEAGLPGYQLAATFGLVAPAGTPGAVVERVNAEVLKALKAPEVLATLQKLGLEPGGNSPQQFAALIVEEGKRWRAAVKAAGIKLD